MGKMTRYAVLSVTYGGLDHIFESEKQVTYTNARMVERSRHTTTMSNKNFYFLDGESPSINHSDGGRERHKCHSSKQKVERQKLPL